MNLTIIIPSLNEKELIRRIQKNLLTEDELITLKITSRSVKIVLDDKIQNAKNDNILIINPRDRSAINNSFINSMRTEANVITNAKKGNIVNLTSSIKFNRNYYLPSKKTNIKNLYGYILDIHENLHTEITNEMIMERIGTQTPMTEPVKEEIKPKKILPKFKNNKPKIVFIADVIGWAWWIKSHHIKEYLQDDFDIDIIHLIGKDKDIVDTKKYDLYLTFGYSYIGYLRKVNSKKRITGVTAHRGKRIINALKQSPNIHANSMLLYNEYKHIAQNMFYTPNGVDENLFTPNPNKNIFGRKQINIGHVGKKAKLKQQETVIEPVIDKLGKDYHYIHHYNDYTNPIPHTDMPKLYKEMDLFIVASLEDGTPNGALEAMASGVPVISNRIGNMPEIIKNGFNGYIIENPTIENYVSLIKKLEKWHIKEMGINARTSIENNWTWKHKAENYRNMFWDLLGK